MNLNDYIVDVKCPIIDVMEKININAKGIVYVVDKGALIGSITDGDIRRYILDKGNLNESAIVIANQNVKYLFEDSEENIVKTEKEFQVLSLPIVNQKREIIKIYFRDEVVENEKEKLSIPVVIMAGGKGTRLYPYTQILPKPLIPIGDKTITEHIMGRFEEYGCNKFTMIINYKKHFIRTYFDDSENNLNVSFVEEEQFLGTGGGLKLLENKINSTFFMTNCDILIEEDYFKILKYHKKNENIITMVCAVKKMVIPYGTVEIAEDDKVIGFKEKPEFSFITNTGFYVLEPEFIKMIPENTFVHITDIIQQCIDEGRKVGVYKVSEDKWLDMGQLEELEKMRRRLEV